MCLDQTKGKLIYRTLDRVDLGQDVEAVFVMVNHLRQAVHLALDSMDPGNDLGLLGLIAGAGSINGALTLVDHR